MTLLNPLPADQFADLFSVQDWRLVQAYHQQRSATGGGEVHYADRAPSMWKAEGIKTRSVCYADAEAIMARINSRAGGIKWVLLYNKQLPFPADDPEGLIIGAAAPKLGAIADRLHVAFTDFPAGYKMRTGSYFGLIFDASRYYLGQFVEDRTASGAGAIASVEIWPPLPASVSGAPGIVIRKPCAKFPHCPWQRLPVSCLRPEERDFVQRRTDLQSVGLHDIRHRDDSRS